MWDFISLVLDIRPKEKYMPESGDIIKLQADQPHPHDYRQTPTDYRCTDYYPRLVIVVVAQMVQV